MAGLSSLFGRRSNQDDQKRDVQDEINLGQQQTNQIYQEHFNQVDQDIADLRSKIQPGANPPQKRQIDRFNDNDQDEIEEISGWTIDPRPEIRLKSGRRMSVYNKKAPFTTSLGNWMPGDKVKITRKKTGNDLDPYVITNEDREDKPSVVGNPWNPCSIL